MLTTLMHHSDACVFVRIKIIIYVVHEQYEVVVHFPSPGVSACGVPQSYKNVQHTQYYTRTVHFRYVLCMVMMLCITR